MQVNNSSSDIRSGFRSGFAMALLRLQRKYHFIVSRVSHCAAFVGELQLAVVIPRNRAMNRAKVHHPHSVGSDNNCGHAQHLHRANQRRNNVGFQCSGYL
jgi:hypothetical protein